MKLYIEEDGSERVRGWVQEADAVATARIAYAEARAAFARLRREGSLAPAQLRALVRNLDLEWESFAAIELTDALVRRAGALTETRNLRGYDAVHLSAALEIRDAGDPPLFGCFDDRLTRAARREGLRPAR